MAGTTPVLRVHVPCPGIEAGVTVAVIYTPRPGRGWFVISEADARMLGWVVRHPTGRWEGRVSAAAFRGDGPRDLGDERDAVAPHLIRAAGLHTSACLPVGYGENRVVVTRAIVQHLITHAAPALGFGRHPEVVPFLTEADDVDPL